VAIVLDASSLIAKLTSGEDFAQQIADLTESDIVLAPDLIILEITN
jgi:predicted nucleic acid-binding protein